MTEAGVVEPRDFGGLAVPDVSAALWISVATVGREWRVARAWLAARLGWARGRATRNHEMERTRGARCATVGGPP